MLHHADLPECNEWHRKQKQVRNNVKP
jgi:hypothetical protein